MKKKSAKSKFLYFFNYKEFAKKKLKKHKKN